MEIPSQPNDKLEKVTLHPVVKKVNTIVAYVMLEYHDSQSGNLVDKEKLTPEQLNLYLSQLHTRMNIEIENNKHFRSLMLHASKLILQVISGGKIE